MPYEKVIAVGDSFTRGDELADCPKQILGAPLSFSNNTWPALIAKNLSINYDCIAVGGRGNQWISWALLQQIDIHCNALFVVNWTYFCRFDFVDPDDQWNTLSPGSKTKKFKTEYFKNLDSDIWNLIRNLQIIHSTFCLLKENNIDFIFTCHEPIFNQSVENLRSLYPLTGIQKRWQISIQKLSQVVIPIVHEFEGLTFKEWSIEHGYDIGPGGHPLEKAHIEAAKYINTHVMEGKNNGHR